ncbi:MAG: CAP domain-containing protein [Armatimonadota bacterium]|nr:CAP domain-containing protein [Armatimonadota bacterium]MDR7455147.1 CAP domain-containing protein [Armatimonadota bacterium]MDR7496442.1 CAP domain-containing protein [Armatimonadota bacterium]MDR7511982.1 CAP domain-containing protein [Armatimonadota bacterium]
MSRAAGGGAPRFLFVLMVVATLLGAGSSAPASADPSAVTYTLPYLVPSAVPRPDLERAALDLVNRERVARGLRPLTAHAGLRAAARAHAMEMFAHGFFSHRSRDGRTADDRVRDQGLRARVLAENLAHARDVPTAHQALMASTGHRRNILFPEFRLAGLAVVDGDPHGVMVVQVFADAVRDHLRAGPAGLAVIAGPAIRPRTRAATGPGGWLVAVVPEARH